MVTVKHAYTFDREKTMNMWNTRRKTANVEVAFGTVLPEEVETGLIKGE